MPQPTPRRTAPRALPLLLPTLLLLAGATLARAQPGELDPSFGAQVGYSRFAFDANPLCPDDLAYSVVVLPDGRIVLAGTVLGNGEVVLTVVGLTPDGQLDPSFGAGGIVEIHTAAGNGSFQRVEATLDPAGRIVLASWDSSSDSSLVVRLLPDGQFDRTFGRRGRVVLPSPQPPKSLRLFHLAIDGAGRILLAGGLLDSPQYPYTGDAVVVRLLNHGGLDPGFGSGGGVVLPLGADDTLTSVSAITTDAQDRVLLTVVEDPWESQPVVVVRLRTDGSPDPRFAGTGLTQFRLGGRRQLGGYPRSVVVASNGKILVGGPADLSSTGSVAFLARLTSAGALDPSFSGNGERIFRFADPPLFDYSWPEAVLLRPDGKILVTGKAYPSGSSGATRIATARFRSNGSLDSSWATGGRGLLAPGAETTVWGQTSARLQGANLVLSGGIWDAPGGCPGGGSPDYFVARLLGD